MARKAKAPLSISKTIAVVGELSPTQHLVLQTLAHAPKPMRVGDLIQQLDLHGNTIRAALATLLDEGLVDRKPEITEQRGRPSWLYEARASVDSQLVLESFTSLMSVLTEKLSSESSNPEAAAFELGELWGARLVADQNLHAPPPKGTSVEDSLTVSSGRLRLLLSRLGYQATGGKDKAEIRLNQCPLLHANAGAGPHLACQVHKGLLRRIVQDTSGGVFEAELFPFAGPGYCEVLIRTGT